MKKLIVLSLLVTCISYAQENRPDIFSRKHEVKAGAIKLLAGPILEGTYEYIQNDDFTFGGSVLYNFNQSSDYFEDFSLTPFARFYFQEKKDFGAKGFFVEGFAKYSIGRDDPFEYELFENPDYEKKYNAFAIGLSLGKKWINKTGFVFEILFGVGRNITNGDHAPDALFRGDFNIGYRF